MARSEPAITLGVQGHEKRAIGSLRQQSAELPLIAPALIALKRTSRMRFPCR